MTREKAFRLRTLIEKAAKSLDDTDALDAVEFYPLWVVDKEYAVGDRVRYAGTLYKCLQAHTSTSEWAPGVAVSLWAEVLIPDPDVIPVWVQPESTNPYMIGDKVHFPTMDDPVYISIVDNNVWAPDAYGWELYTE